MQSIILALPPADEGPAGGGGGGGGSAPGFGGLMPFLIIIVLMMFLMPLFSKKERHRRKRIEGLKKHDKVVTSGGIYGTVVGLDEGTVTLEVAKDVRLKVKRSSIFDLASSQAPEAPAKAKAKAKG